MTAGTQATARPGSVGLPARHNMPEGSGEALVAEQLAEFKRPRRWEFVDELPRSTMGKVLKRVLRDHFAHGLAEVSS